nr:uncharacterized protein LOC125419569 [Ziziphus jujuba var. spinosa]
MSGVPFSRVEAKLLSQADQYTLVKFVVAMMLLYAMSSFKMPIGWCHGLEKMTQAFLWKKRIIWLGSMGLLFLRDIFVSPNKLNIRKSAWSLATEEEKMWVKALKAKYVPYSSFMMCRKDKNCSWMWKGVLSTRNAISKGLCYRVGKANSINYWENLWIPNDPNFRPIVKEGLENVRLGMMESLRLTDGSWNQTPLMGLFDEVTSRNI